MVDRRAQILEGPVGATLVKLTVPMMVGIAAILFFNLVDTFWVGQLGGRELAAIGFTFPVTMVVSNLAIGLSIGSTAVIARALGENHPERVKRLTTDSLVLAVLVVSSVCAIGILTIDPLFLALGAEPATLPLVREYMVPWYLGVGMLVVPMVGNGAIRATGDTLSPAVAMVSAGLVNAILDPIFIFGFGPFPALRLQGAALSTVLSYSVAMTVGLYLLGVRERMLTFVPPKAEDVLRSWGAILRIGLPAAGTNLITPLSAGVITRLVAAQGEHAVAALGVGGRLEGLSMIGVFAMTAAITPFVGQNMGARKGRRIEQTFWFCLKTAVVWGGGAAALLSILATPLARTFNDDPEVVAATVSYLRWVPPSYAMLGFSLLVASMFNALQVPLKATLLAAIRLVVLALPLAWVGARLYGLTGLFFGIAMANAISAAVAMALGRQHLRQTLPTLVSTPPPAPSDLRTLVARQSHHPPDHNF